VPIALAAWLILREPPRSSVAVAVRTGTFSSEFKVLIGKRSYVYLAIGTSILALQMYGVLLFVPSYLVRSMGLSLAQVGAQLGPATVVGTLLGTLGGGWLGSRIAHGDGRRLLLFPVGTAVLAIPLAVASFTVTDVTLFLILVSCLTAVVMASMPPIFSAVQYVCGSSRRALASALLAAGVNAFAMSLGPLITGGLSDWYSFAGTASLRYALLTVTAVLPVAATLFFMASRSVAVDAEH
jgi:MFS family permease